MCTSIFVANTKTTDASDIFSPAKRPTTNDQQPTTTTVAKRTYLLSRRKDTTHNYYQPALTGDSSWARTRQLEKALMVQCLLICIQQEGRNKIADSSIILHRPHPQLHDRSIAPKVIENNINLEDAASSFGLPFFGCGSGFPMPEKPTGADFLLTFQPSRHDSDSSSAQHVDTNESTPTVPPMKFFDNLLMSDLRSRDHHFPTCSTATNLL